MTTPKLRIKSAGFLFACFSAVSLVLSAEARPDMESSRVVQEAFDRYGEIAWKDERARLDNFAIQLLQERDYVGYIFVFNAPSMCRGEAQARAVRAKKYIVEHRGVPWNRVVWREGGYREELLTVFWIFKPDQYIGHYFFNDGPQKETYAIKNCNARIARITRSKW